MSDLRLLTNKEFDEQNGPSWGRGIEDAFVDRDAQMGYDNPGGDWLEGKQQYAREKGYQTEAHGKPFPEDQRPPVTFGDVTAYIQDGDKLTIPTEKLKNVRGLQNEQYKMRADSSDWMQDPENVRFEDGKVMVRKPEYRKRSPEEMTDLQNSGHENPNPWVETGKSSFEEHAPFIQVDQDGNAWINEGNHRISEAIRRGEPTVDIEIRWFNGGEQVDGPWNPKNLIGK